MVTVTCGGSSYGFTFSAGQELDFGSGFLVEATPFSATLLTLATAPCFRRGTHVLTERGEVTVEGLGRGDLLLTQSGAARPIRWIGHRDVDCRGHPRPSSVWPVRVAAHAFGDSAPHRDLFVSPDHAVFVDSVLIPIRELVNGSTIVQEPHDQVVYFHVELDRHDVVLAEGLPCESYLDTGNRSSFTNGGRVTALHPDFAALHWEMACVPLMIHGLKLAEVRSRLARRAIDLGLRQRQA